MRVGYVGLGAMGKALAARMLDRYDPLVWDINEQATENFVRLGGRSAHSLASLGAECDVVFLCLPGSANVEAALFGPRGLAETLVAGSVVVDQTSGNPPLTKKFAEKLAARGIGLIDAPVSGGVPSAQAGTITIMTSGDVESYNKALPALKAISANVFRCGDSVGDAQTVKAINNLVNTANRLATLEVAAVGRWLGLDISTLASALSGGVSQSFLTDRLLPAIAAQRPSTDFALGLMLKDLNQASALAFATGAVMPVSETARGLLNIALSSLGDRARLEEIVVFMARAMKTNFVGEFCPEVSSLAPGGSGESKRLLCSALAACHRLIMIENIGLAKKAGLALSSFGEIMLSGSAASAEAAALFASDVDSGRRDDRTIGQIIDDLDQLVRIGTECAIPMMMINQTRIQCVRCADIVGPDKSIGKLLDCLAG